MPPNLLLYAIPAFVALLAVDALLDRRRRKRFYRLGDSVNDLSMGLAEQVFDLFLRTALLGVYVWFYNHARIGTVRGAWGIAAGFVLYDFFYYWAHRSMHEVNVLWAGHAPHHQSEEYNLAVALRQGAFQNVTTCFFFWPMALVGISPWAFVLVSQLSLIYQFGLHTRSIGRLGVLEAVFNTPSHHRVHHGRNPRYLDRNHAGVFIVWDRMFGTFQLEADEPVYGTIEPLRSWNPIWGQVKFLAWLAQAAWTSPRWTDRLRVWFAPAGWTPQQPVVPAPPEVSPDDATFDPRAPRTVRAYATAQFAGVVALALVLLAAAPRLAGWQRAVLAVLVLTGIQSVGGLFESKRWVRAVEPARLVAVVAGCAAVGGPWAGAVVLALAVAAWLWFRRVSPALGGALA